MATPSDQEFLMFQAVIGAHQKDIPISEAVPKITGLSSGEWDRLVSRILVSFGDLEIID